MDTEGLFFVQLMLTYFEFEMCKLIDGLSLANF